MLSRAVARLTLVLPVILLVRATSGQGSIHDAVRAGDWAALEEALADEDFELRDLNERDALGYTPLHRASEEGNDEIVARLLKVGAGVGDARDSDGLPLTRGTSLDSRDNNYATALMHAAGGGFVGIIELLVDAGAALSAADEFGLTALHYAAESGQVGAIRALLARGADVHAADETGKRAIDVAHAWGFPEAARALGATASELAAFAAATTEDASAGEDQDVQPSPNTGSSALNPEKLEL